MDKDFLLRSYGECYDKDAGPWNLGVKNKYLEYMIAKFFEENFAVSEGENICNVGIGAGYWDRYLSYQLKGGSLTSIDIDEECCRSLKEGLINEHNPNSVEVIHSDVMLVEGFENKFDIFATIFVKHNGSLIPSYHNALNIIHNSRFRCNNRFR